MMTAKNEQNETIILTPEQEAIKRLEDKLISSKNEDAKFKNTIEEIKYFLPKPINQQLYDFLSEYLSLKSYATTVVDLFKKK